MNYKKLFLFVVLIISLFIVSSKAQAGTTPLKGWGWSSNIGWISFSSANPGLAATPAYGVTFSTTTPSAPGNFGGYAWSPNIGWISFDATDGSHASAATDLSTGFVTGWARACAGTVSGDCLGASRTDGWDGWIRLSDTGDATPKYPSGFVDGSKGITFDPTNGNFKGYSWGDTNVGWLAFSSNVGVPFTPPNCEPNCGGNNNSSLVLTANGENAVTVRANSSDQATVRIGWDVNNVSNVVTANANWPVIGSGSTGYPGHPFGSDDETDVLFTGIVSTTTKTLQLSYWNIAESFSDIVEVHITLEPYRPGPPTISCLAVPANAQLCGGSTTNTAVNATVRLFGMCNVDQVPPVAAAACEFYCPDGFRVVNNTCRRQGTIEER